MHTKLPDKSQQIFRFNGGSQCSRNIWLIIYKIHYLKHLGNRDTASFTKVVESQPYGDELNPVKLECVGYYQKRTGNGSQHNRKDLKGVKLSDGREISGRDRLTVKVINTFQNYVGMAKRQNDRYYTDKKN